MFMIFFKQNFEIWTYSSGSMTHIFFPVIFAAETLLHPKATWVGGCGSIAIGW